MHKHTTNQVNSICVVVVCIFSEYYCVCVAYKISGSDFLVNPSVYLVNFESL